MNSWIEEHFNKFKRVFREGLQGKIFRLCLIVIADAVFLFAIP